MKLATYTDGSRDGQLVVVSRDLSTAHFAQGIASRLQAVLDDWGFLSPQLEDLYATLNGGKARHAFPFDPLRCMAPLPRAHAWIEVAARGAFAAPQAGPLPVARPTEPLLGPCTDLAPGDPPGPIEIEPGLAVLTADVEAGIAPAAALERVRLLMLVAGWRLPALQAGEEAAGSGPFDSRPAVACAPVAVTPDELGDAWRGGRLHLELALAVDGRSHGRCAIGQAMERHVGELIARAARRRALRAGCIVGSGALIPSPDASADATATSGGARAGTNPSGAPSTGGGLAPGARVRVEVTGRDGLSVFGAIDQRVAPSPESD